MLNKSFLTGRLTKDPEIRYTKSSDPVGVARFNIAVDRNYKKDGEKVTDFFEVEAWRKQAEFAEKYLKKGQLILIEGRFESYQWEDKSKNKRSGYKLMVDNFYFIEKKQDNGQENYPPNGYNAPGDTGNANAAPTEFDPFAGGAGTAYDPFADGSDMTLHINDDDDLPF